MDSQKQSGGRSLVLRALSGHETERVPATVMTWGFDYTWKVAGLEPWQLAFGGSETWHKAHLAVYDRHQPDIIWYMGGGGGSAEPEMLEETPHHWLCREGNGGERVLLLKESLCAQNVLTGEKTCDPDPEIETRSDIDRRIGPYTSWGRPYLDGLRRLIADLGDRALVLPNYCTSYIAACYTLGFQKAMRLMLDDPALLLYLCDRIAKTEEPRMQELAEAGCEAVLIADAWASCDVISPEAFERFALPYQASMAAACRKVGLNCILWNEGDVGPILRQQAELDYDAFTWEQPRKNFAVSVADVREVFGPSRCLMGNLDSEALLLRNEPAEIETAVREQLRQSGEGNPFILSTGSPLPSGVSPDAVDAVFEALRSCQTGGLQD